MINALMRSTRGLEQKKDGEERGKGRQGRLPKLVPEHMPDY